MLIDAHAHISLSEDLLADIAGVISRCSDHGVVKVIDNAIDIESAKKTLELARLHPSLFIPTIGIHPELFIPGGDIYDSSVMEQSTSDLMEALKNQYEIGKDFYRVTGECGLDYYWIDRSEQLSAKHQSDIKTKQKELLIEQMKFAQEVQLPVVIHSRGAEKECLEIVQQYNSKAVKILFHSYTGPMDMVKEILSEGYYISFNGIVTFPKAQEVRDLFLYTWKNHPEQILSETDAPYLAPVPKRGERCEPADVALTMQEMIKLTGDEKLEEVVYENALGFYGIQN